VHDNRPPTSLRQSGDIGNATPAHLAGLKPQSPYLLMKANLIGARLNGAKGPAINSNLCAVRCGYTQHRFGVSKSTHIAPLIKIEDVERVSAISAILMFATGFDRRLTLRPPSSPSQSPWLLQR
jgi:hypothetical protein